VDLGSVLSSESRQLAGILLLALVTVESGGLYLVKVVTGRAGATAFQTSFARAGHAHAGVLLILALVCQVFADSTSQTGLLDWLSRSGVAVSALLMPAGFFFSSMGAGRERPNRLIVLVFAGAALLAASLISLALGLLTA
jgi:Ni,Fe-hydrogenase I cytochrome b subunit